MRTSPTSASPKTGTGANLTGGATADYMAPERIRGEPVTSYADIYAFGAVVYECLSGAVPFPSDSPAEVANAHLADPPPGPSERRPEQLPAEVDGVIAKAMAKNPGDRYETAVEMVQALEQALENPPRQAAAAAAAAVGAAAADSTAAPEAPAEKAGRARATPPQAVSVLGGRRDRRRRAGGGRFFVGRGSSKRSRRRARLPRSLAGGADVQAAVRLASPDRGAPLSPASPFPERSPSLRRGSGRSSSWLAQTASWPTLLPASFHDRVLSESDLLAERDVVLIGKRQAFRYQGVSLRGEPGRLTVFVLPVRGGVEMLSCVIPCRSAAEGKQAVRGNRCCRQAAATGVAAVLAASTGELRPRGERRRRPPEWARQSGRRGLAAAGQPRRAGDRGASGGRCVLAWNSGAWRSGKPTARGAPSTVGSSPRWEASGLRTRTSRPPPSTATPPPSRPPSAWCAPAKRR